MKFILQPYSIHELGQRENQEDSIFPAHMQATVNDRLFILCDGMGGHEKGEVASATVCKAMSDSILSQWNPEEPLSDEMINRAVNDAYDALDAKDAGEERKMGTTMTLVCFHANGVTVAHMGDSRIYQLRPASGKEPARIVFRTTDHSLVNDLIRIGEITEAEAKHHPQKNIITRAMQPCQPIRARADIAHLGDVKSGDYFYMCSDGMLEQTTDENLLFIITKDKISNEQKVEMLRNVTSENLDNHTAHIICVENVEGTSTFPVLPRHMAVKNVHSVKSAHNNVKIEHAKKKKSFLPYILTVLMLVVVVIGGFMFYPTLQKSKSNTTITSPKVTVKKPSAQSNDTKTIKETVKIIESHTVTTPAPTQQKPTAPVQTVPVSQPEKVTTPVATASKTKDDVNSTASSVNKLNSEKKSAPKSSSDVTKILNPQSKPSSTTNANALDAKPIQNQLQSKPENNK